MIFIGFAECLVFEVKKLQKGQNLTKNEQKITQIVTLSLKWLFSALFNKNIY